MFPHGQDRFVHRDGHRIARRSDPLCASHLIRDPFAVYVKLYAAAQRIVRTAACSGDRRRVGHSFTMGDFGLAGGEGQGCVNCFSNNGQSTVADFSSFNSIIIIFNHGSFKCLIALN